jgi:hypothetical protein
MLTPATDAEAPMVSKHVVNMPAGGNTVGIIVKVLLLVIIILSITDFTGLADVFPFVKKYIIDLILTPLILK